MVERGSFKPKAGGSNPPVPKKFLIKQILMNNFHILLNDLNVGFQGVTSERDLSLSPSKMVLRFLSLLQEEGFIQNWWLKNPEKVGLKPLPTVRIKFKPAAGRKVRVNKTPQQNLRRKDIEKYASRRGLNCLVLTTNYGLLTHNQCIRYGVGGQVVCELTQI